MKVFLTFIVSALGFVFLLTTTAEAEDTLSWLHQVQSCEEVMQGIDTHLASASADVSGDAVVMLKARLKVMVHEACYGRFAQCNLPLCKSITSTAGSTVASTGGAKAKKWTDPYQWLLKEQDCAQVLETFRQKYAGLGKYSDLAEPDKLEVDYTLDRICSQRFAFCNFAQCASVQQNSGTFAAQFLLAPEENSEGESSGRGKEGENFDRALAEDILHVFKDEAEEQFNAALAPPATPSPVAVLALQPQIATERETPLPTFQPQEELSQQELAQMADSAYQRILEEEQDKRRVAIELALEREKEQGLSWVRLSNPDELQALEQRRVKRRDKDDSPQLYLRRRVKEYSGKSSGSDSNSARQGNATRQGSTQGEQRSGPSVFTPGTKSIPPQGKGKGLEPIIF